MLAAAVQELSFDLDDAAFEVVEPQVAGSVHVGEVGRHLAHAYVRVLLVLIESLKEPCLGVVEAFGELLLRVLETFSELLFRLEYPRIDELADLFDERPSELFQVLFQVCPRDRRVSIGFHMLNLPCLEF
jgi:hypothetical protein